MRKAFSEEGCVLSNVAGPTPGEACSGWRHNAGHGPSCREARAKANHLPGENIHITYVLDPKDIILPTQ